jgi:DNA-binding MarR family transcriptional regulator
MTLRAQPRPDRRQSSPTRILGQRRVVNIDGYIPYFLTAVNNALSRGASARYVRDFGVGIGEWRVMSMLAIEPGIAAARICAVVAMDKGAVSRALCRLETLKLLRTTHSKSDPRRRSLSLTRAGYDLHDKILGAALEREAALTGGVDPDDLEAFLRVMRIMRANVNNL